MRLFIASALLFGTVTAAPARLEPSFSCKGKLSVTEQLICADDQASYLDKSLSLSYRYLREWLSPEEWKEVAAEQRQWLAERDRCQDTACVVARMKERSDALEQRRAAAFKYVQSQLADKAFVHAAVIAGMGALRQKYEGIDDTRAGTLTEELFQCSPIGYHKFHCHMPIGIATCYNGDRDSGSLSFDVKASSAKDFELSKVEAVEACGTPIPTRARR